MDLYIYQIVEWYLNVNSEITEIEGKNKPI